jgi:hypothetical protein
MGYGIFGPCDPAKHKLEITSGTRVDSLTAFQPSGVVMAAVEPSRKKHIYVPKGDVQDAMKQVVEKHIGGKLPEDATVTNQWTTVDKWCIEIDSNEFPQNVDGTTSQEIKPRKR